MAEARKAHAKKGAKRAHAKRVTRAPRARLEVDERRAQLLALGLSMFGERSYDEVSIDDIARAAGISKGLIYHYFPTKRDLYVAALGQAAGQLLEETMTDRGGTPEERLKRGLSTYLDFVERHETAYAALMRGGIGSDPEIAALLERTRETFAARIFDHVPGGGGSALLRAALRGWVGFVEATALDWARDRRVHRDDLVTLFAGALFDVVARAAAIMAAPRAGR